MRPEEVAELSSLLDQAQALAPDERERWLGELEVSKPEIARHLRSMLTQTQATDTALLGKLPALESERSRFAGILKTYKPCLFPSLQTAVEP